MAVEKLLDVMEQLNSVHLQLVALAQQKQQVLVNNQVDELNRLVNQESKLIRQVAELDRRRTEEMDNYLVKRGFRPDPRVTVTDLIKTMFKAEEKQAMQEAQQRLLDTLEQLKQIHQLNQEMIQQSLAFIHYSYDLLLGPPEDEVVYKKPAHQAGAIKRPGVFDTRA